MIFIHLIPCISLIIFNILLLLGVAEAERKRKILTNNNIGAQNNRRRGCGKVKRRDSLRITVMSVIVISVFLMIEIPLMIITMLHALSTRETQLIDYDVANHIVLVINTFMCLTCPLNLAIYCGTSKQFRKNFYNIVGLQSCTYDVQPGVLDLKVVKTSNNVVVCPYIEERNRNQVTAL